MTKDVLLAKARRLGLNPPVSATNEELEKIIGFHNYELACEYGDKINYWEPHVIRMGSPMLAKSITEVPVQGREHVLMNWRASEKVDGIRALCGWDEDELRFFTRGKNVDTLRPISYVFDQWNPHMPGIPQGAALLDGELIFEGSIEALQAELQLDTTLNPRTAALSIVHRSVLDPSITMRHPLSFVVFDIYMVTRDFDFRWNVLKQMELPPDFRLVETPIVTEGIDETNQEFLNRIIQGGGEGIILKNPDSFYIPGKSRSHGAWVKVKVLAGGGTDINSDSESEKDAQIIGFEPSLIHRNLVASAIIGDEDGNEIGRISGFSTQEKFDMFLSPELFIGRWLTFTGNQETTANKKVAHARFVRWKEKEER